jgi:hypothetical protein
VLRGPRTFDVAVDGAILVVAAGALVAAGVVVAAAVATLMII